jgi:hypothetical protein
MKLDRLILIHKTHLDVGFTDLAGRVLTQYLEHFIPAALKRAREMNKGGGHPEFIWTTGAWIIWKALQSVEPSFRKELEAAIAKGWITWHALPFTFHTELLNPALMRLSLKFCSELDLQFGKQTVSAKMTDVPGHTMGLVPILAEAGVEFLHIGVNPASKVPDVPSIFRWRCDGKEIVVAYSGTYGDVTTIPGLSTGLTFLHTNDNLGPPDGETIRAYSDWIQQRYALNSVRAGTLDEFARLVRDHRDSLPVIDSEIGDSWIHGIGSDPQKISDYCAMRRVLEDQAEGYLEQPLPEIAKWLEPLLLVPEHTWGLDAKAWLGEHSKLGASELAVLRRSRRVRQMEESWQEQRAYIESAMDNAPFLKEAVNAKRASRQPPTLKDSKSYAIDQPLVAGRWAVRFEPATGCLAEVYDAQTGLALCPSDGRMNWGLLRYEHFGKQDYQDFLDYYMGKAPRPWWAEEDFKKRGLTLERRETATLRCGGAEVEQGPGFTKVLIRPQFMGETILQEGIPENPWLLWTFSHQSPRIELSVGWSGKAAVGLAEALWLGFRMPVTVEQCLVKKSGQWINPQRIVSGGAQSLHAIEDEICLPVSSNQKLKVVSEDAPLFSLGDGRLLPCRQMDATGDTLWFNLFNNVWNTNFRLWNAGGMTYRFLFETLSAN